ncbi:MAG: hypothetical protein AAFQ66_13725 [Pseudomonadota bacterium]
MTPGDAAFVADAWVSLCAALAAWVVLLKSGSLTQSTGLASRLRFCLRLVLIFMAVRIGHWGGWGWLFSAVTNAAAALLPLSALLLAEGMLRRHASSGLKKLCAWGSIGLVIWGLLQIPGLEPFRIGAMLAFQLVSLSWIAIFAMRRDRARLADEENQSIDRMTLAFALILPFLATDYLRDGPIDLPVRMGGLAVLAVCWIAIGANRSGLSTFDMVRNFLVLVATCAILAWVISNFAVFDPRAAVQAFAVLVATVMLLAVWQAALALSMEDPKLIALRHIADASGDGEDAALAFVKRAAGAPDSVLVDEGDLNEVNIAAMRNLFEKQPAIAEGPEMDEQISWLLSRYGASHALALSTNPLRLALLDGPAIVRADHTNTGLRAIQRVASDLATRAKHD